MIFIFDNNIDEIKIGNVLNIHKYRYASARFIINHHYRTIEWREYETIVTLYVDSRTLPINDVRSSLATGIRVSLSLAIASNGDRFVPVISRNRRRLTPAVIIAKSSIAI